MSFGKREGWKGGFVIVHGRKRASCRILSLSTNSIVFEVDDARVLPYQFEILMGDRLVTCEFKSQRGLQICARTEVSRRFDECLSIEEPANLMEATSQWAGWRPSRGFRC